jgi:hypothetical protein
MDDKMKMLFDFANNLSTTNNTRPSNNPIATADVSDNKNSFVIDKLVFTK